jgi:hypothetical protein
VAGDDGGGEKGSERKVVVSEPIYKQVIRDVEARAEVGKATYGRYLMEDVNGRNPLQDAYEEQIDGAKYLKQAIHERRALIKYVARLEVALREIAGPPNEPDVDGLIEDSTCTYCEQWADEGCAEDCPRTIAADALATSPLSGQPQAALASPWRPIAEAPRDGSNVELGESGRKSSVRTVQWDTEIERWYLLGSAKNNHPGTYYDDDDFTHYRYISAPPQERGVMHHADWVHEMTILYGERHAHNFRRAADALDRVAALERELAEARKPCPCKVRDAAIDAAIDAAMGGE